MKSLFAGLYSKIADFLQGNKSENTSKCATNRLQVILMHDRTKLDALTMNMMREELIGVFSKYVIIDKEALEIGLKSEGDAVALMLNIPIVRAKTEEELRELKEHFKDVEDDEEDEETVKDDDDDEETVNDEEDDDDENDNEEASSETVKDDSTETSVNDSTSNDEKIVEDVKENQVDDDNTIVEEITEEKI